MNKFPFLLLTWITALLPVWHLQAGQAFTYPSDALVLGIEFPDHWSAAIEYEDGEEYLRAVSPDEAIEIELWSLDEDEVADDPKAAVEAAVEEVNELIEEYVTDFQVSERTTLTVNGIYVAEVTGVGEDIGSGEPVEVSVEIMTPNDQFVFIMMYWGDEGAKEAHREDLVSIVQSLTPLGGQP